MNSGICWGNAGKEKSATITSATSNKGHQPIVVRLCRAGIVRGFDPFKVKHPATRTGAPASAVALTS
jgi:hypothetical protein